MEGFRYSIVASPLHDAATVGSIIAPVRTVLDGLGGTPSDDPTHDVDLPHLVLVATGGTERIVLDLVRRRWEVLPWEPVVLVAHPLHNSLPAALETMARIRGDGGRGRIVQTPDDEALADAVGDLRAIHRVRGSSIGLVGAPSDWLVASVPDRDLLLARWGVGLTDIDIGETIERQRTVTDGEAQPVAVRFTGGGAPSTDTMTAAKLHPALVETIERTGVDAVAVRCFDFLTELATSGCVALAELNDRGVVAGCEGDVASTVAMLVARHLFDQPAWIANPASVEIAGNTILLAHCTVAPSMVNDIELHTHFESGLGVGLRGRFSPGWVTLMRLGGHGLDQHWFADGEVMRGGDSPDLCRTQVTIRVADQPVAELLEHPLGNHVVMIRGRHRDRLERWWRLAFGES